MDKVTIEFARTDIREVKSVWDEQEANDLLNRGDWIMMHAGLAHKDVMGFQAKPIFIMARIGKQ